MEQPKPIFIELHDRYDFSHKMMINIYAIETIESYRVNLRERGYDVAETYDEMKIKIETAMAEMYSIEEMAELKSESSRNP